MLAKKTRRKAGFLVGAVIIGSDSIVCMNKFTIVALFLVALFGLAYYGLSPLFINIKADDTTPASYVELTPAAQIAGTPEHSASGTVRVIESDGKRFVRYENFRTINGPDLYVYLSKDLDARKFIDLGQVRATEGNINYEVPDGVDLSEYHYVLTWCKSFGVLFNSAKLSSFE